jgi:formate dehydrogenase subunit gamma
MASRIAKPRLFAGFLLLLFVLSFPPISAAQHADVTKPNAQAVQEQQLLQQFRVIQGRGSIPDVKSYVLEHPAGREWGTFHVVILKWIAGVATLGILAVLTTYYSWHGPVRLEIGRSSRRILRFSFFERFVHWLTGVTFVVMAITGLNITFGRSLLLPLIGPEGFSEWSAWAKFVHNHAGFPFTLGIVLMFLMWVRRNLPSRVDFKWFKSGGGMFGGEEPPTYKFNGGEKLIFWIASVGGGLAAASGFVLLFPFYGTGISFMEATQIIHSVVGVLYIASMFVHFYMGTIGVEGAFEGMVDGTVDANWAKERHSLWYKEECAPAVEAAPALAAE